MKNCGIVFAICLALVGCESLPHKSPSSTTAKPNARLNKYLHANPVADAQKSIRKRDIQFLAIRGFAVIVPGVPNYQEKYRRSYSYCIIEGTSDVVSSPAELAVQRGVRDYAEKYNQTLLSHLREQYEYSEERYRQKLASLTEDTIVYGIDSTHLDFIAQRLGGYQAEALGMCSYEFLRRNVVVFGLQAHNHHLVRGSLQASSPVSLWYWSSDGKRSLEYEFPIAHGVTLGEIEEHFREFIRRIDKEKNR